MTWHAAEMPDDALPPDSLVGRMLNVKPTSNEPQIRFSEVRPELLAEAKQFLDEYADDLRALAASERAELPLWRVMVAAFDAAPSRPPEDIKPEHHGDWIDQMGCAAEIEALRDWLLPEEPEPQPEDGRYEQRHTIWQHNNKLRAQLTEQARIARGD